ncbi:maltose alpha-D-glucosyltransferase [Leptolyngbya sp. PL-A3]|nr:MULTISPECIES: maltose alpha-D-glucosyltransferase [unclassified Leptolyngbya]
MKDNSLWFKDAVIYEISVRAFADSNGDGIGDFRGLTERLDYLQELGVTALWILPFFPSPLRDDGYDIADYTSINPIYGTLEDFKELLDAAHQRDIRIIIELIINHTSDQHPWFQRARRAPKGSPERDFYVWSDTPEKYSEARIIFQDFESSNWAWDPIAKAYYWHRFYSHQPDLNYDNLAVHQAVFDTLDFWLDLGVDGLRMDAVPYLYEREGTNCENLPETHAFLKKLRKHVDEKFPSRMLLAEANQWPEDAAYYYGNGDECHMNFHFPLMPRLFMALRMEDNFPIVDILQQTPEIPDNCQWGLFLRNHDELTLEMVTDEDRDYMYRVYAQDPEMRLNQGIRRRLAPLLGNDRRQIELLNSLLLSLPGTPVLYYGDEIGMGDNIYLGDRNGVRTPMQWTPDRNAGFSRANPHRLFLPLIVESEYHYNTVNVEAQRANPNSLLNSMKRLLATRKRLQAFTRGDFQLLHSDNRKVFAFTRTFEDEQILVVANLSRFVQTAELDLTAFQGRIPIEVFGRTEFPPIHDAPYFLSVGPYAIYWFTLKLTPAALTAKPQTEIPTWVIAGQWQSVFLKADLKNRLETYLPEYLSGFRWFNTANQAVQAAHINEAIALPYKDSAAYMVSLQIDYIKGDSKTYLLFLGYAEDEQAIHLLAESPESVVARLRTSDSEGVAVLFNAIADKLFLTSLLSSITQNHTFKGMAGGLTAKATELLEPLSQGHENGDAFLLKGEHCNTSIIYCDSVGGSASSYLILKLFRKVEEGINPDLEIRRFLDKHNFENITSIAGYLEYRRPSGPVSTIGILQQYIPDARNTWDYTLDSLRDYFEQIIVHQADLDIFPILPTNLLELQAIFERDPAEIIAEFPASRIIGAYLANVQLLGQRTAELHVALASDVNDPDFAPEPFSGFYQRSIYQYSRNLVGQVFWQLKEQLPALPEHGQTLAQKILGQHQNYLDRFRLILDQKISAMRTRYHGEYHLGQVLYTGKDFFIIDFEGDPSRNVSERRMKRSPLRDVASMLQSFYYAASVAFQSELESGIIHSEQSAQMQQWVQFWISWVSAAFLHSYLTTARNGTFLPKTQQELKALLDNYLLEKAIYDLGYELNRPSESTTILLQRILEL